VEPSYFDIAALSAYLSLSESTIRALMKGPDPLPSFTVGRSRRFFRPAVDAWMACRAGASEATSQAVDALLDELRAGRR
jgi:predicted DNA-binding transcriptional regulator AlpA